MREINKDSMREFLELVREMREEQKRYFKSKSSASLQRSKRLEGNIDKMLDMILGDRQIDIL